ncbi:MAG: hypothetical protein JO235_18220 [Chroococcidiopsidaceae cyanobacterium CP_BM_RX_35]|nr:hypothetical protein [Chroococcidiopsidaceae cyanobacterium CP_BM_RX_35]
MKKKLNVVLKYYNYYNNEQGFAMPIAVVLGLIMLLIGGTMLLRSLGDQVTASAQKATSRALGAAETGITHYQAFIISNKIIATYPDCVGIRNSTTGACPDTSPTASWANASSIPGVSSLCGGGSSQAQTINGYSTTNWQDVDTNDASKGQYKLVSYTYTPNTGTPANTAPGTGTLTVQGRINQVGTSSQATATVGTGTTQLQVSISINPPPNTQSINAGLWATSFSFNGNGKANANVLDSSCGSVSSSFDTSHLGNLPSPPYAVNILGKYTKEVVAFPPLPNNNTYIDPTGSNVNAISTLTCNNLLIKPNANVTFPQNNDVDSNGKVYGSASPPSTNATYTYVIPNCKNGTSIDLSGTSSVTLGVSGQETIIFYVDGDITATGNGGIAPYRNIGANTTTKVIFYVQGNIKLAGNGSTFDPSYFQFYKYGPGLIELTGNGSSYAFIFAPQADTKITGNGDVNGALWTKTITDSGNGSVNQGMINISALQTPTLQGNNNVLGSITSWQRQEASP